MDRQTPENEETPSSAEPRRTADETTAKAMVRAECDERQAENPKFVWRPETGRRFIIGGLRPFCQMPSIAPAFCASETTLRPFAFVARLASLSSRLPSGRWDGKLETARPRRPNTEQGFTAGGVTPFGGT